MANGNGIIDGEKTTKFTVEPHPQLRRIWKYMRDNVKNVPNNYEEFQQRVEANPDILRKIYDFMKKDSKVKVHDTFEQFQSFYTGDLKKKEEFIGPPEPPDLSAVSSEQRPEQNLTYPQGDLGLPQEDFDRKQALEQLAQRPDLDSQQKTAIKAAMDVFGKMTPEEISELGREKTPEEIRQEFDIKRQREADLIEYATTGEVKPKPGSLTALSTPTHIVAGLNRPMVDLIAGLPKTAGIAINQLDRLIAGATGKKKPSVEKQPLYQAGQWIQDKALEVGITATNPKLEDNFWLTDIPQAFGSVMAIIMSQGRSGFVNPLAITRSAPTGVAATAKEIGKVATRRPFVASGILGATQEFDQAIQAGSSEEEAFGVFLKNYAIMQTEAIPIQRALARINRITGGGLISVLKAGTVGGVEEGAQEAIQGYLTNKVAQGTYDPGRDSMKDLIRQVGAGVFVGFFLPGIIQATRSMTPEDSQETLRLINEELKTIKQEEDAIRQRSSKKVFQRPQEGVGGPRSERVGVEPRVQGKEVTGTRTGEQVPVQKEEVQKKEAPVKKPSKRVKGKTGLEKLKSITKDFTNADWIALAQENRETAQGFWEQNILPIIRETYDTKEVIDVFDYYRKHVLEGGKEDYIKEMRDYVVGKYGATHEINRAVVDILKENIGLFSTFEQIARISDAQFGKVELEEDPSVKKPSKKVKAKPATAKAAPKPEAQKARPTKELQLTPKDIHQSAQAAGIDYESKAFMDKSEELTGKRHLDDMTPKELGAMQEYIQAQQKPDTPVRSFSEMMENFNRKLNNKDFKLKKVKDYSIKTGQRFSRFELYDRAGNFLRVTDVRIKTSPKDFEISKDEAIEIAKKQIVEQEQLILEKQAKPQKSSETITAPITKPSPKPSPATPKPEIVQPEAKKQPKKAVKAKEEQPAKEFRYKGKKKAPKKAGDKGSTVAFKWLGFQRHGVVMGTTETGRVRIKGTDGTIYNAKPEDIETEAEFTSDVNPLHDKLGFALPQDLTAKIKGVGRWLKKYFTPSGLLPKDVFNKQLDRERKIAIEVNKTKFNAKDFMRALSSEYGSKYNKESARQINEVLSGRQPYSTLPEKTAESVRQLRDHVDRLSKAMIDEGIIEGNLVAKVTANMGFYLNRTYKVHDDNEGWISYINEHPDGQKIRNRAVAFIKDQYQNISDQEVKGIINELLYEPDAPLAIIRRAKLGSKDLGILMERKDIAPEIRALLGEYEDPLVNYSRSIVKMATLMANSKFLNEVRTEGIGKYLFERPVGKFYAKIASDQSKTMNPLNGLYTTEDIAEAFNSWNKREAVPDWIAAYYKANGFAKYAKTVLSPQTHVRNAFSNTFFELGNGRLNITKFPKALQIVWTNFKKGNNKAIQEKFQEYLRLGIVGESVAAGDLKFYLSEVSKKDWDIDKSLMGFWFKVRDKTMATAQGLYRVEDEMFKVYAYEIEYADYKKAFPNLPDEEVKRMAANVVRNTTPTYSLAPEAIKWLRRFPLVSTFPTFTAEVIRTAYNTIGQIKTELSRKETRSIGVRRLSGALTLAALPTATTTLFKHLYGVDDEEDEAMESFVPPWGKGGQRIYTSEPKPGVYQYIDLAYSDPHSYFKRPIKELLLGTFESDEGFKEHAVQGLKQLFTPFIGEELMAERLIDIARNKKKNGGQVYNPEYLKIPELWGEFVVQCYNHIAAAVEPGAIRSYRRIEMGVKGTVGRYGQKYDPYIEAIAVITGQRVETRIIAQDFIWKAKELKVRLDDARYIYTQVAKSKGTVTEKEKADALAKANLATRKNLDEFRKIYNDAITLGVWEDELKQIMTDARITGKFRRYILGIKDYDSFVD